MATDIIARGMITEYKSGTNINFKENDDGSVTISASGDVSSEDTVARETIDNHKLNKNNPHNVTAEQIGLNNVNNTADLDKPISTAVQTALDNKANIKHTHKKSDITDFPNSLPADGGNADTVNNHTVGTDVPTNALFTDTVYDDTEIDNRVKKNTDDISQLFDITKGGEIVNSESSYTLTNAADYPIIGLNMYGKSTQDGVPTPENPVEIVSVGDSGAVEITACGKNLVNPTEITTGGFDYATGTELNNPARARTGYIAVTPAYLVGSVPDGYGILSIYHYTATKEFLGVGGVSLLNGQNGFIRLLLKRNDGAAITDDDLNTLKSTLIVTNGESVDYEPYKGNTASITTALPLCGIPVESGGNYTDRFNGQQWICDELIYNADGTGKIIKRTAKIDSYNGEAVSGVYISSTGGLDTGATVIYQIDTPQEIALAAAEMTALRQLQTFEGVSNISNDNNANMDVKVCTNKMLSKCVMPILSGLQNQIDELKAAVLSLGGNV